MQWPVWLMHAECSLQSWENNNVKRVWNLLFAAAIAFSEGQETHVQQVSASAFLRGTWEDVPPALRYLDEKKEN